MKRRFIQELYDTLCKGHENFEELGKASYGGFFQVQYDNSPMGYGKSEHEKPSQGVPVG